MSEKIDVLVVTFNNSRTLRTCLNCIRKYIPYNRVIIGDGGSSDATVRIAREMGAQVYMYQGKDNMIGRIRYKIAKRAETEWVLFIDSDTYVYPSFWKIISRHMKTGVGIVMAAQDTPYGAGKEYYEWASRRLGFATFSNALVPRRLILECTELIFTNNCEDSVYESYLMGRNCAVVRIFQNLSYHDKPLRFSYASFRRSGRESGYKRTLGGFMWQEIFNLRNLIWFSLEMKSKGELLSRFNCLWEILKGFLEGLKGVRGTPYLEHKS